MNENKEIRFIDTDYNELFRIPDGGRIIVSRPMGEMYPGVQEEYVGHCSHLDEAHVEVNGRVFHICEFAEIQASIGATYKPEKEPEMISSYRVIRRTTVGDKIYKLGVSDTAATPYATWQGYTDPAKGNDWGHYWSKKDTAEQDFFLRASSERTGEPYDYTTLIKPNKTRDEAR